MLDTPKLEEVVGLGDRCVFKTNQDEFVKYLFAEKGDTEAEGYQKSDFLREYFIGGVLMRSTTKDHLVETKDGDYYPPSRYLKALENIPEDSKCKGNVNRAIRNGELIPYIVTKAFDADTVDLFKYLSGKKDVSLSADHIRKIMFQLTWIVAYMQSKYGVQHNDIHEKNIMVRPAREKMDLVFQIEDSGDTFELSLEKGELEVFIFDFGASAVKPNQTYPTDAKRPWQNASEVALQINNAPEVLFSNSIHTNKNSEGDLFMMGHVLLTLLAHGHDGFNVEDKKFGIHTRNLLEDDSKGVRTLADKYNFTPLFSGAQHPVFENDAGQPEKAVGKSKVIMTNLYAIGRAFGGLNKAGSVPTYATSEIKTFLKLKTVQNYVTTYFKNTLGSIAKRSVEFGCYRFLRRLLDFEPSTRCQFGVSNQKYGAMGALFHPYFSAFYKGYKKPIDGQAYIIPRLAQPLEYQAGGKNNETRKFIKGKEDTFITDMAAKLNQAESDAAQTKQRWDDAQSQQKKSTKKKTKEDAGTTDDQKEDIPAVVITPPPSTEDKGKEEEADIPVDNDEVDSSDSGVVDNPEDDEETSGGANDNNVPVEVPENLKESVETILEHLTKGAALGSQVTKDASKIASVIVNSIPTKGDRTPLKLLNIVQKNEKGTLVKNMKDFKYTVKNVEANAVFLAIGIYAVFKKNYTVIQNFVDKFNKDVPVGQEVALSKKFVLENMGDLFGSVRQVVVEPEKEEKLKEPEAPAMEEEEPPQPAPEKVPVPVKPKPVVTLSPTEDKDALSKVNVDVPKIGTDKVKRNIISLMNSFKSLYANTDPSNSKELKSVPLKQNYRKELFESRYASVMYDFSSKIMDKNPNLKENVVEMLSRVGDDLKDRIYDSSSNRFKHGFTTSSRAKPVFSKNFIGDPNKNLAIIIDAYEVNTTNWQVPTQNNLLFVLPLMHATALLVSGEQEAAMKTFEHLKDYTATVNEILKTPERLRGADPNKYLPERRKIMRDFLKDSLAYAEQNKSVKAMISIQHTLETIEHNSKYVSQGIFQHDAICHNLLIPIHESATTHLQHLANEGEIISHFDRLGTMTGDFDFFKDFDDSKKIKYLHCMSVAAAIMNSIENGEEVSQELHGRINAEWPSHIV